MPPAAMDRLEPVYFTCGVADPDGRTGYVADGGAIVAVDLGPGRAVWRTELAWRPLIVTGDRLAAASVNDDRANEIRIVLFDPTGEPAVTSEPVVLPDWASTTTVRLSATVERDRLMLEWEAHARYGGGAAPSRAIERAAVRDARGIFAVDLASGVVTPGTLPADPDPVRRPPVTSDDLDEPWLAGEQVARLTWTVEDGEQALWLETTDPPAGEEAAGPLVRGHGVVVEVTADGRHLFVHSEPVPTGDGTWSVFSAESGRRVATLTHERGAHSPAVLGPRAYYVVERGARALNARQLDTDTLDWELPLGERPTSRAPRLRQ
jgi:hypothetical protein